MFIVYSRIFSHRALSNHPSSCWNVSSLKNRKYNKRTGSFESDIASVFAALDAVQNKHA